ncbi:hypothetical protein B0A55_08891 [Friedmanniomyces simplex]|uniref:Uncharacterized protein n=1 Tax=Friedmanniomyces simplex TaxID=329884 RepID=A0A4U0XDJ4_9PEZI|nr:hypothetical protein B0A55_08891 [Friedmanniomyces simplex]
MRFSGSSQRSTQQQRERRAAHAAGSLALQNRLRRQGYPLDEISGSFDLPPCPRVIINDGDLDFLDDSSLPPPRRPRLIIPDGALDSIQDSPPASPSYRGRSWHRASDGGSAAAAYGGGGSGYSGHSDTSDYDDQPTPSSSNQSDAGYDTEYRAPSWATTSTASELESYTNYGDRYPPPAQPEYTNYGDRNTTTTTTTTKTTANRRGGGEGRYRY